MTTRQTDMGHKAKGCLSSGERGVRYQERSQITTLDLAPYEGSERSKLLIDHTE